MHAEKETTCDLKIQAISMINYIKTARYQQGNNVTMELRR